LLRNLILASACCLVFGCGGSTADDANVGGNWHGSISSGCSYTMSLSQSGVQVSGTLNYSCPAGSFGSTALSGAVNGQALSLSINSQCGLVNMNATISGSSFTGTWNDVAPCWGFAVGTAPGNYTGGSGTWNGTSP
jgi:hypothetical protein